ncbi:TraR/DksA family transcriptional regulator [Shimia litoralis]
MNVNDRLYFQSLIQQHLATLEEENRLGHDGQAIVTLDQQSVGRLSRMDALQSQAMAKAQQSRRDASISALHKALERLSAGEFGYCDTCGDDIARKRLEFDPSVRLCISCASG